MVPVEGFEPPILSANAPQALVYANSTTPELRWCIIDALNYFMKSSSFDDKYMYETGILFSSASFISDFIPDETYPSTTNTSTIEHFLKSSLPKTIPSSRSSFTLSLRNLVKYTCEAIGIFPFFETILQKYSALLML